MLPRRKRADSTLGSSQEIFERGDKVGKILRRPLALFVVGAVVLVFAMKSPAFVEDVHANPPTGFQNESLIIGLDEPVDLAFAPDNRMFIAERGTGKIRIVEPGATSPNATPLNTIISTSTGEKGIVGFVLDPDFVANGYYYVFYTKNSRDVVSRFTASGDTTIPNSEVVIWSDNADVGAVHHGGGIAFGIDGRIYISTGDHHDTNFTLSHVSQRLDSYRGKILRVNKNGTIPVDNPFYDGSGPNLDAIWAVGLRNPFRIHIDQQTGRLYIADVGGNNNSTAVEEINLGAPGANYGWPLCEGSTCTQASMTKPLFEYPHNGRDASITGGFIYHGGNFPQEYQNSYFYADYAQNWIRRLVFDQNGNVVKNVYFEPIDGALDGPYGDIVAVRQGPDGALYYVNIGINWDGFRETQGAIRRVSYTSGNQPPTIHSVAADPSSGPGPLLSVTFSTTVSDPEGDVLSYSWQFDDGHSSAEANPQHTFTNKGKYVVRLTVSDGIHQSVSDPLVVEVGYRPVASILEPADHATFRAGQVITYSGSATDADSSLAAANYSWKIVFHHEDHVHPVSATSGATSATLLVPRSGHSYSGSTYYEIFLTVTDSDGLEDTKSVKVYPEKTNLQMRSSPTELAISVDQRTQATPFILDELKGLAVTVHAPEQHYMNGKVYDFVAWSDNGSRQHELTVPDTDTAYTAVYAEQKAGPGGSLFYDGKDDIVRTTNIPLLQTYTFEVWFKRMSSPARDQVVMSDGNLFYTQAMFSLVLNGRKDNCPSAAGEIAVHQWGDKLQCSGVVADVGKWYHVAVTRDAEKTRRIYVNGTLTSVAYNTPDPRDSSGTFTFGRAGSAGASYFEGYIDEARISDSIVYNGTFVPPSQPLSASPQTVGLWHFNEGQGQTTADTSTKRYHGTLGAYGWADARDPRWLSESPLNGN